MIKEKKIEINAIINVGCKVLTTLISLFTLILITKRISNTNYGTLVFCESITSYFMLIASLGISDYAIRECAPIRDNKEQVNSLVNRMFSFNIITSFVSFALLLMFEFLLKLSDVEKLIVIIYGIRIFFSAFELSWVYKLFEDYLYISIGRIAVEIFLLFFSYIFIYSPKDYVLFAVITVAIDLLYNLSLYIGTNKYVKLKFTLNINVKDFIWPVMILFFSSAMVTLYLNADITMLGFLRSNNEVGLYKIASKVYLTITVTINSICIVSMPRISYYAQNDHRESLINLADRMLQAILIISIPAIVGVYLVCDNAIPLIFGQQYIESCPILKILSIAIIFSVVNKFFIDVLLISLKKEKNILVVSSIAAALNILFNAMFIPSFGANGAALATLISEIIVFVLTYIVCKKVLSVSKLLKNLLFATALGAIIFIVCVMVSLLNLPAIIELILQILISIMVYSLFVLILKKKNAIL